jgi:hypothetical protein
MASRVQSVGSRFQTVIVILVFAGIVGGLTFVRQWLSPPVPPPVPPKLPTSGDVQKTHLTFLVPEEGPDGKDWIDTFEFEIRPARGHHDFWFRNDNDEPVVTGIDYLSCSKCVTVDLRLLTEEQSQKYRQWLPKAAAAHLAGIPGGVCNLAGTVAATFQETDDFLKPSDSWHYLKAGEDEVQTLTIPAKTSGLVRLGWVGVKVGKERARADLWTELVGKNEPRGHVKLVMPMMFVAPLIVYPAREQVELGPGDHKTLNFYCWSDTNAGFHLQANEKDHHPCFTCSWAPLSRDELRDMGKTLRGQTLPTAIFGYRVLVTVSERAPNGQQLDLGDFSREIMLTSPDLDFTPGKNEFSIALKGKVQGDLTVGAAAEKDKVDLGIYQSSRGTVKEITLRSPRPDLQLKKISNHPSFLEVALKEADRVGLEGKRWKLTVKVPPNRAALPEDGIIILETNDQPPRKVRIPVTGLAVWSGKRRS